MKFRIHGPQDSEGDCFLSKEIVNQFEKMISSLSSEEEIIISQLRGDGSQRCFYRVWIGDGKSLIIMYNPRKDTFGLKENASYVEIANHLSKSTYVLPKIYAYSQDLSIVLLEDLGDLRLYDIYHSGQDVSRYYGDVVQNLVVFQTMGIKQFDPDWCCQTKSYNREVMLEYECKYFLNAFLRGYLKMDIDSYDLSFDFEHIISVAQEAPVCVLIHRDFQSRNIMVKDGKIRFVDWQGARPGPAGYDLASLLVDPYVNLNRSLRERVKKDYLKTMQVECPQALKSFEKTFEYLLLLRNLQILGAFSFLSKVRGKQFFEQFIPIAARSLYESLRLLRNKNLKNLTNLMAHVMDSYFSV